MAPSVTKPSVAIISDYEALYDSYRNTSHYGVKLMLLMALRLFDAQWPILLTRYNFNPDMDK